MSTAEIKVNKLSVKEYLESGSVSKFLIPDYQRPYSWGEDEVMTLWEDITTYFEEEGDSDYFCGTIVTFRNENGFNEIIDGQQRTTTLLLMLRSMYRTLESSGRDDVNKLKSDIEACLWQIDKKSGEVNREEILINSLVANDKHNDEFLNILKTGEVKNLDNNYAKNYQLLSELIQENIKQNPADWTDLCVNIINHVILLPIECEDQDTALTIFSTLNDRGLALSDADIFKAKIYNHLDATKRPEFIEEWKELELQTESSKINIQTIFYYYMFYLRALENDIKTTTPALRKYFARNQFSKLYDDKLMSDLSKLSDLWKIIYNREELEEYPFSKEFEIKTAFDILGQYSNEYWKYIVSSYFLSHYQKEDFIVNFKQFLYKMIAYIVAKLTINPTLNAVKTDFLYLNRDATTDMLPDFYKDFTEADRQDLEEALIKRIKMYHKATRPLLYILTYQNNNQNELLPERSEVEHILPRKWSKANLFGKNREDVEDEIESLGNKIILDKKLIFKQVIARFTRKKKGITKIAKLQQ